MAPFSPKNSVEIQSGEKRGIGTLKKSIYIYIDIMYTYTIIHILIYIFAFVSAYVYDYKYKCEIINIYIYRVLPSDLFGRLKFYS